MLPASCLQGGACTGHSAGEPASAPLTQTLGTRISLAGDPSLTCPGPRAGPWILVVGLTESHPGWPLVHQECARGPAAWPSEWF